MPAPLRVCPRAMIGLNPIEFPNGIGVNLDSSHHFPHNVSQQGTDQPYRYTHAPNSPRHNFLWGGFAARQTTKGFAVAKSLL